MFIRRGGQNDRASCRIFLEPCADCARRHLGPVDHHHRQVKRARGLEFRPRTGATRILGHDQVNCVLAHQRRILIRMERPTGNYGLDILKRQSHVGRINQPDQVVMLRSGRECRKILLADGEKDTRGRVGQRLNSALDVSYVLPAITRTGVPRRPFECGQRHIGLGTGKHRIAAHLRGEGMRGVDDRLDLRGAEVLRQPGNTTEAANPRGQRLRHGRSRTPGIGEHRVIAALRQGPRQLRCFAGAAQNKDAWHG